jgi:hypothetical protein
MKKIISFCVAFAFVVMFSCQQDDAVNVQNDEVPADVKAKLEAAGFATSEGLYKYKDGYIVEYDIFFTPQAIDDLATHGLEDHQGKVDHYRTNNLVTGTPRTIRVYIDGGFGSYMQNAFNTALARYNALGLTLTFAKTTTSSNAHIRILSFYEVSNTLGFSAGFPTGGNPASPIQLNTYYYNNTSQRADAATVIAHEIGHAIGFRHTDYMNRAFSCGSGGSEGSAGVGANHISGTPTGPSSGSWMLACSNGGDRPFTTSDKTALTTVY